MAKIDEYLAKILSSRYGKDVRGAIHDSIDEINKVNEANISTVQTIANTAQGYADDAEDSKDLAEQAVTDAQAQVTLAQQQVTLATTQAENASDSAEDSEAWAVGKRGGVDVPSTDDTYQNNAKYWQERANYWYQQAQIIAESFSGALRPMGTVEFANLPSIASAKSGDMYNISDEFTTTSDFVEGAGIRVPLGSNVYLTVQNKWDILAGSPVTGIKGNAETTYRRGNVNITKDNIGLGNVRNVDIGDTDISGIGNGTVTGAISTLNSKKISKSGDTMTARLLFDNGNNDAPKLAFRNPTNAAFIDIINSAMRFFLYSGDFATIIKTMSLDNTGLYLDGNRVKTKKVIKVNSESMGLVTGRTYQLDSAIVGCDWAWITFSAQASSGNSKIASILVRVGATADIRTLSHVSGGDYYDHFANITISSSGLLTVNEAFRITVGSGVIYATSSQIVINSIYAID